MATIDPIRDIKNAIEVCTQTLLGVEWKKAPFLEELEKNNSLCQNKVFGVRVLEGSETSGLLKHVTISQTFEVVLVRAKLTKGNSDSDLLELSFDNRRDALCVYKEVAKSRVGLREFVSNISDLTILAPEFIEEGKVVVQRIQFLVNYRCEI